MSGAVKSGPAPRWTNTRKYRAYLGDKWEEQYEERDQICDGCGSHGGNQCSPRCRRRAAAHWTEEWDSFRRGVFKRFNYEMGFHHHQEPVASEDVLSFDDYWGGLATIEAARRKQRMEDADTRIRAAVQDRDPPVTPAPPRLCEWCGKHELTYTQRKYCSRACANDGMDAKNQKWKAEEAERLRVDIRTCPDCGLWYQPDHRNQKHCHYEACIRDRKKNAWAQDRTKKPRMACPLCKRDVAIGHSIKSAPGYPATAGWIEATYAHRPCGSVSVDGKWQADWIYSRADAYNAHLVKPKRPRGVRKPKVIPVSSGNWSHFVAPTVMPPPSAVLPAKMNGHVRMNPQNRGSVGDESWPYRVVVFWKDRTLVEYYAESPAQAYRVIGTFEGAGLKWLGAWIEEAKRPADRIGQPNPFG